MIYVVLALIVGLLLLGIFLCIKNSWFTSLIISLAGIAGMVILFILIRNHPINETSLSDAWCGTARSEAILDYALSVLRRYGIWFALSLLASFAGIFTSAVNVIRRRRNKNGARSVAFPSDPSVGGA